VDVIVFSIYQNGYKQCSDTAVGTYVTPVAYFMQGYLSQKASDAEDQGLEYELPSAAQYAYCTPFMSNQVYYYFQLGCSDVSTQEVAVNIYEDSTCTRRSAVEGIDDANVDVSEIQVSHSTTEVTFSSFATFSYSSTWQRITFSLGIAYSLHSKNA
jgi:hypothetical protein